MIVFVPKTTDAKQPEANRFEEIRRKAAEKHRASAATSSRHGTKQAPDSETAAGDDKAD